jgi:hypothetical protein
LTCLLYLDMLYMSVLREMITALPGPRGRGM